VKPPTDIRISPANWGLELGFARWTAEVTPIRVAVSCRLQVAYSACSPTQLSVRFEPCQTVKALIEFDTNERAIAA